MSSNLETVSLNREGIAFALVGPAGVGKTTFCQQLVEEFVGTLVLSVSATTRTPRSGEIDGISKHFLTRQVFEQKIADDQFFEWEEVHGNFYGQLRATLEESIYAGKDLLLDIDVRGAMKFKGQLPENTVVCFLLPPDLEHLKARILARAPVSTNELETRLATARQEYRFMHQLIEERKKVDYFVINHDREQTYQVLRSQLIAERSRASRLDREDISRLCQLK